MQTQSIQSQQANKPQQPKSPPLPSNDFQNALALEIDRQPVCAAPEQQPSPAQAHARQPRPTQAAKPAQQAQGASQAERAEGSADAAQAAAGNGKAAAADDGKPAAAGNTNGATDEATDKAASDAAPAADPAAGLLAMLAAYGQMTRPDAKSELPDARLETDAAALAALQSDKAGKATLADLAARAGKAGDTSALQDAGADRLLGAGAGELSTDRKADAFDAQLGADLSATLAANVADSAPVAQPALPAAQAMAATMQAANAVAANQLQARVGSNAWEQQLGQKVVWMVAGGDQSASLTLNPPDLGPLQVVLNVSNDSATATFTAHQPETRQAIENALPKLREMMNEAGIALGNATVSAGSQDQQQAFAEQARGGRSGGLGGDGDDADATEKAQPVIRRTVLGAVDTFA